MDDKNLKKDDGQKGGKPEQSLLTRVPGGIRTKFKETVGEFRKIIWPDKNALAKHTVNTIVISALIGAVIVGMDYIFSYGYSLFIKLGQ